MLSLISDNRVDQKMTRDHPVKTTALLCLKEALAKENFEECKDMIQIAHEFGAEPQEIHELLVSFPFNNSQLAFVQRRFNPIISRRRL